MYGHLLIHTAVVYRRQQVGGGYKTDRFGQPTRDEQPSHVLACRLTAAKGGEQFTDRMHDVVQATHTLFLEQGADLSEQDVVTVLPARLADVQPLFEEDPSKPEEDFESIVDRAEVLLARAPFDGVGEHHREAKLTTQRQSGEAR